MNQLTGPQGVPFFGNTLQFKAQNMHTILQKWQNQFGSIFQIKLFNKKAIVISDPFWIRKILKERPKNFRRISTFENYSSEMKIRGVFTVEGNEWVRQRRIVNSGFTAKQVHSFLPYLRTLSEQLANDILSMSEKDQRIDISRYFRKYSINAVIKFAFGYEGNALNKSDHDLGEHLDFIFHMINIRTQTPIPYWRYFKLQRDRKIIQVVKEVHETIQVFIENARKKLEAGGDPKTVLDAMILAGVDEKNPFSNEELIGNALTLLIAGEDTTTNLLSWIMYFLAQNSEIVEKLREELAKLPDDLGQITVTQLSDLPLLDGVIYESLRLKPVAPLAFMENNFNLDLNGHHVPKGTFLILDMATNTLKEEYFSNPKNFNPLRWHGLEVQNHEVLMPFGAGPRICPAVDLATLEVKMALIPLIRGFNFQLSGAADEVSEVLNFSMGPSNLFIKFSQNS